MKWLCVCKFRNSEIDIDWRSHLVAWIYYGLGIIEEQLLIRAGYLWIRTLVTAINASWELTVTRVTPGGSSESRELQTMQYWHDSTEPGVELEHFSVIVSSSDTVIISSLYRKEPYTIRGIFIRIITRCLCKALPTNWQMTPISIHWHEAQLQAKHSQCMPG